MTIIEMLQNLEISGRVSVSPRWLVWDVLNGWVVYERKAYERKTKVIIQTYDEHEAVKCLVNGDLEV
jgi:hypothetical protein